jgi:hypothetical protein
MASRRTDQRGRTDNYEVPQVQLGAMAFLAGTSRQPRVFQEGRLMNIISVLIIVFILLETSNVIALYFFPGSRYANSVGVFKAWEQSKQQPEVHDLVKYLVNWVAGTKLIFLLLLTVVIFTAEVQGLFYTGVALVLSISSFFWRLYPLIRKMDRDDQIEPKNYSATLGLMISILVLAFLAALVVTGKG